jgi:hypothetical protein
MGAVSAKGKVSARECRIRIGERIREGVPCPHRGSVQAGPATGCGVTSKKKKPRSPCFGKRGVNPAATYSPGPEGQVPSAI